MAAKKKNSASASGRSNAAVTRKNSVQKKSNANRSGSSRKSTRSRSAEVQENCRRNPSMKDYALYYEIILWVILALAVLMFISLIGLGGALGKAVSAFIFGVFGIMGYLFPFALFFLAAFLISNSRSRLAKIKAAAAAGLFIVLCAFMQLILVGWNEGYSPAEYYEAGALYHTGGGFLGGCILSFFTPAIGTAGTVVILLVLVLIFLILITQRSFLAPFKRSGMAIADRARQNRERRKKEREQEELYLRQQSRKNKEAPVSLSVLPDETVSPSPGRPRMNNRVRGVTTKTGLFSPHRPAEKTAGRRSPDMLQVLPKVTGQTLGQAGGLAPSEQIPAGTRLEERRHNSYVPQVQFSDETEAGDSFVTLSAEPTAMDCLRSQMKKGRKKNADNKFRPIPEKTEFGLREDLQVDPASIPVGLKEGDPLRPDLFESGTLPSSVGMEESGMEESGMEESGDRPEVPDEVQKRNAGAAAAPGQEKDAAGIIPAAAPEANSGEHHVKKPRSSEAEIQAGIAEVAGEIATEKSVEKPKYIFPPIDLLKKPSKDRQGTSREQLQETAAKMAQVFHTFGVNVKITNVTCGPSVTRYELMPEMGVKVSKIVSLQDDIKLNLAASDIRIEAPIPGKAAVGIEVPNKVATGVLLREVLDSDEFRNASSNLTYAVGRDIAGNIIVSDIAKMPHLMIAGATGSGKSVFINTLIMSIIYKASPEDVKMIMIDPKVVELSVYNGIPHLFIPVVTDPKKAAGALNWSVAEMTGRYKKFADCGVRDIKGYNKRVETVRAELEKDNPENKELPEKMPQIVIIVDELADLMMVASGEVEDAICRLAQLARAAGIHLVIATQRPSVDVITGLIKANMPSRIAFSVSSGVDSRTILDMNGAEKLLGNGDMLFAPQTYKQPLRVQGAFVSDQEVAAVVDFLKEHDGGENVQKQLEERMETVAKTASSSDGGSSDVDELFADAGKFLIEKDKASIGMLQRWFKIGFNRAARIMDQLSDAGVVGPEEGTKPRKILMSAEQFENYLEQNG